MDEPAQHAGDCTIYRALINGGIADGICTCGYGWSRVRMNDFNASAEMFSKEKIKQAEEIRSLRDGLDRTKQAFDIWAKSASGIISAADALEDWLFKYSSPGPQQKVSIHIKNPKDDSALLELLRALRAALKPIRVKGDNAKVE